MKLAFGWTTIDGCGCKEAHVEAERLGAALANGGPPGSIAYWQRKGSAADPVYDHTDTARNANYRIMRDVPTGFVLIVQAAEKQRPRAMRQVWLNTMTRHPTIEAAIDAAQDAAVKIAARPALRFTQ